MTQKRSEQEELVIGRLLITLLFQSNTSIFVFLPDLCGMPGGSKIVFGYMFTIIIEMFVFFVYCIDF